MPLFLKIRNINNVGLHFHVHVEILCHGCNVFPCSHDMLSRKLCFLFAFSHTASATETTILEAVIVVSFSNLHSFLFTSSEVRKDELFIPLSISEAFCIIRLLVLAHIISENKLS